MDVKKFLFISPPGKVHILPNGKPAHRKHCTAPLGLAYLSAQLLEYGLTGSVIDMLAEGYDNEKKVGSYIIYGLDIDEVLERIEKEKT